MVEPDDADGEQLVREAKPPQGDPVAEVMLANVRRSVLGVDADAPKLGRFTLLEPLGAGAMSSVVGAYDPVLDRKVALKLLRRQGDSARRAILREARSLARLTHPNVVAVYEVDEVDERVYIAMELVQGDDLQTWLADAPRSWREVVDVMAAAGTGLGAAHAAGLVHSDFKPQNVLVGTDRRGGPSVRVADFGMARGPAPQRDDTADDTSHAASGGTPLYMAPERLDGAEASAASDQFAFAVTLFEALYGVLPFKGGTVAKLRRTMDEPVVAPRAAAVPSWLDAIVRTALAIDPKDRFPSMDALVDRLVQRPSRRRRRMLIASIGLVLVGSVAFAAYRSGGGRDPCAGGVERVQAAYGPTAAAQLRAAFDATRAPFAGSAFARVDEALTTFARDWAARHRDVCEATRVRGDQSDSLYDVRMRCLDRQLDRYAALATTLEEVDTGRSVANAVKAARALPDLADCDASDSLYAAHAEPADPAARNEVLAARRSIERGWALYYAGRYDDALETAAEVATAAEALGFEPLTAQALFLLGSVQGRSAQGADAEATLRRAQVTAAASANDQLSAAVMLRLLRVVMLAGDTKRVGELADLARAAALRARGDANEVDGIVGESLLRIGEAEAAEAAIRRALSTERRPHRIALLESNLGSAMLARGEAQDAVATHRRALETATADLGEGHPGLAFHLGRLGRSLVAAGHAAEARDSLVRALKIREDAYGAHDRAVATTLGDLAAAQLRLGHLDDAEARLERALTIRRRVYGDQHPRVADLLVSRGDVAKARRDYVAALELYGRARAMWAAADPAPVKLREIDDRIAGARELATSAPRSNREPSP